MSNNDFGTNLKKLRKQKKLSQADLGTLVGVSNRAVSKWENGEAMPSTEKLIKISSVLQVPLANLMDSDEQDIYLKDNSNGMHSLAELYKIGKGPSSSHTLAPKLASEQFLNAYSFADSFKVILYGSLAKMGRAYKTDKIIEDVFKDKNIEISFDLTRTDFSHPCTMHFYAYKDKEEIAMWEGYSIGGGSVKFKGIEAYNPPYLYKENSFEQISKYCEEKGIRLWQYVEENEGKAIWNYLKEIWECMQSSIESGLNAEGVLDGGLFVARKAKYLYNQNHIDESSETKENRLVCAYAFAVSEQNASCETVVTAPTCGASGILPAVLKYIKDKRGYSDEDILHALATAGLIGNLIKTNASIIGAECGCQAEVGSACAMAAAALGELYQLSINQIEYAAEIAIEHHLGLTCDPIKGLVQIPCIERNAVAAMRAINAVNLANFLSDTRKISFDLVVQTMYETGLDLPKYYKETSEGGLAKLYL